MALSVSLNEAGAVAESIAAGPGQRLLRLFTLLRSIAGKGLCTRHLCRTKPVTWRERQEGELYLKTDSEKQKDILKQQTEALLASVFELQVSR